MNRLHFRVYLFLFFLIALLLPIGGCREPRLQSKWLDREITIDGEDTEWQDCRLYYDEDTRTTLGVYNDDKYLHIGFATGDRMLQRKIINQGLYTWFNDRGNDNKKVGILFPTGMMGKFIPGHKGWQDRMGDIEGSGGESRPDGFGRGREPNRDPLLQAQGMSSPDIEIHIPNKEYETNILLEEISGFGFDAQLKHDEGRLVYELRMPLVENDCMPDIVVGAGSGRIGIGFMTKEMARKRVRGGSGGRGSGGGRSGPGGGMGGPGGGMGRPGGKGGGFGAPSRGGTREILKPYELWTKVELAIQP